MTHEASRLPETTLTNGDVAGHLGFLPVGSVAPRPEEQVLGEMGKLDDLLRSSEVLDGRYELVKVGEAGYVVRLTGQPPELGNDWVFSDLDDTLVAYTQAKTARLRAYQEYLHGSGLELEPEEAGRLLDLTDTFARWSEQGTEMYHLDAHKAALAWATASLRGLDAEERQAVLGQIGDDLDRMKSGVSTEEDEPFYVDGQGQFRINKVSAQEDIDAVFDTMVRPGRYADALDAMIELASEPNDEHRVNLGVFTYGGPEFQLHKTLELLRTQAEAGRPAAISQIWLTKVPKGEFVNELLSTALPPALEQDLFGGSPHAMLLLDDSVKELESILRQNEALAGRHHVAFTTLRSVRPGTKTEHQPWPQKIFGEYDPGRSVFKAGSEYANLVQQIRMKLAIMTNEFLKPRKGKFPFHPGVSPYTYRRLTRRYDAYVDDIYASWPAGHTPSGWGKFNWQYDKSKHAASARRR